MKIYISTCYLFCIFWTLSGLALAQSVIGEDSTILRAEDDLQNSQKRALDSFLIETALLENIPLDPLREAFADFTPQMVAKQYMSPKTSRGQKNWAKYVSNVLNPRLLKAGKKFIQQHHAFLQKLEKQTGVPAQIITAILGVETGFGQNMGYFPIRDILVTFSFDYPQAPNKEDRQMMFQDQLRSHILNCIPDKSMVDTVSLKTCLMQKGSYAGAIGMPQFMPSSIRQFAQDGDGDGVIDLRQSPADAMQSVASFLVAHGWQSGQPILLPIANQMQSSQSLITLADGDPHPKYRLGDLKEKGLIQEILPPLQADNPALIIDLPSIDSSGKMQVTYWVGLKNFEVLTQYNRSFFYAMSVTLLGKALSSNDPEHDGHPKKRGKPQSTNNDRHGRKQ